VAKCDGKAGGGRGATGNAFPPFDRNAGGDVGQWRSNLHFRANVDTLDARLRSAGQGRTDSQLCRVDRG